MKTAKRAIVTGAFLIAFVARPLGAVEEAIPLKELRIQYLASLAVVHQIPQSPCGGYLTKLTVEPLESAKMKVRPHLTASEILLLENGFIEAEGAKAFSKIYQLYVPKRLNKEEHKERCMAIIGYTRGRADAFRDLMSK